MRTHLSPKYLWSAPAACVLAVLASGPLSAADDVSIVKTIKLIDSMVEHGALTRERADVMIKDAIRKSVSPAASDVQEQSRREILVEMKSQMAADIKRQILAELTGAGGAALPASPAGTGVGSGPADAADPSKARVVRVPYVPETMRREIREQIKQEVLTQAKEERWANPNALPEWLDRFSFEGDVRLRHDAIRLGNGNTSPGVANYVSGTGLTRAADLVGANGNFSGVPNGNTQEDFNRTRLRFRLGATATISDKVLAGLRISTGNTTGPTSTNQTLGQGLNKYTLVLDRGFITLKPWSGFTVSGGRIANPFFSTDLVWADDLNFEGVAASYSSQWSTDLTGFVTGGWFPLRTDSPLQSTSRNFTGLQAGVNWQFGRTSNLKLGAALYSYRGMEGQLESAARYGPPSASDYGTRYEYPNGLRQRGNTLFITNAIADPLAGATYWGLASGFREFNLTGTVDIARFDPVHVVLTGDYVKNLAFDRSRTAARTGASIVDGKDFGYLGKVTVGYPSIARRGEWNASLAYRWLGSDAVLDAFTNSDFGLGGTNSKGYILGGSYGLDKNTWVSIRWMSSQLINSAAPKVTGATAAPTKLSVDLLQIDLNAKF